MRRARALLPGMVAVAVSVSDCTTPQRAGTSSSYLIVDALLGASGAEAAKLSTVLNSDVATNGGVLQDPGEITLRLALRDPGSTNSPSAPSSLNYITLSRYHVRYVRSDGRNTPGVDVPYAFDSGLGVTVGETSVKAAITLVRIQAKLEAPLKALVGHGGALAISTIAEVTFYGTDQTGREVSAVAIDRKSVV